MNLKTAIARFDTLYPNSFAYEEKIAWLSELDGLVHSEILCVHTPVPTRDFKGYTLSTPGATELLLPFPYDSLYIDYLSMKNDLINGDITRYNNAASLVNRGYEAFQNHCNRTKPPVQGAGITV